MHIDARGKSCDLLVPIAEGSREELPNPWLRVGSSGSRTEDMEALPVWTEMRCLHRPQESEVHIHSVRVEYEAAKMVRVDQRLWIGDSLPSRQSKRSGRCFEQKESSQSDGRSSDALWVGQGVWQVESRISEQFARSHIWVGTYLRARNQRSAEEWWEDQRFGDWF